MKLEITSQLPKNWIVKFLEKYFGSEILIKIPKGLYGIDNKLSKAINIADKLKKLEIIKNITIKYPQYYDEPFSYIYYVSCPNKAHGTGADFFDKEKTIWKSLAEAIERYLWYSSDNFYKNIIKKSSYKGIKNNVLNIFSLAGFSEEQKNKFPILQFNENTIFNWVPTYSLISKRKIFCPIQLVSALNFNQKVKRSKNLDKKTEPMLRWCVTTGLSTGRNLEEAIVKGILEVIERDAFMISYLNKLSPPLVDLEYLSAQDEEIAKIIKNFKRYNLEIYALQLPTDFPDIHIIAALIIDRTGLGPAFSVGASADFNLKTTLLDALSESLSIRFALKFKDRFKNKIYLNKIGQEERIIYWAKPENLPKIEFFLKGEKIKIDLKQNFYEKTDDRKYYKEKLKILIKELKEKNYEACYVELTTKEIKKLNLRSVFVVIPELQPLHLDESIPYFGGKRLKEVPLKLGYQPLEILNQEPHPFP